MSHLSANKRKSCEKGACVPVFFTKYAFISFSKAICPKNNAQL